MCVCVCVCISGVSLQILGIDSHRQQELKHWLLPRRINRAPHNLHHAVTNFRQQRKSLLRARVNRQQREEGPDFTTQKLLGDHQQVLVVALHQRKEHSKLLSPKCEKREEVNIK